MRKDVNSNIKAALLITQKVCVELRTEFLDMRRLTIVERVGFIRESGLVARHI